MNTDRHDTSSSGTDEAAYGAVLAASQALLERELGKPVTLTVAHLNTCGKHAFVQAAMREPTGQPLDYADTRFREAAEHGAKSDLFMALFRHDGKAWAVVTARIGPTDLAWAAWAEQYAVPEALFPSL